MRYGLISERAFNDLMSRVMKSESNVANREANTELLVQQMPEDLRAHAGLTGMFSGEIVSFFETPFVHRAVCFKLGMKPGEISDGYHTFDELYHHRIALFIVLCREIAHSPKHHENKPVWRSKKHFDGSSYEGWFIMGIGEASGEQITYHLPMDQWEACWFAPERPTAPEFDGHKPDDVLQRLKEL